MNAYTLNNIPAATTHVWTPPINLTIGFAELLMFYYKRRGKWRAYSRITGWRETKNPPEWFTNEKEKGFFITLKTAHSRCLPLEVKKTLDK